MADLIWLVPLSPLVGVIVNGLVLSFAPPKTRRALSGWIATAASGLAFVFALLVAMHPGYPAGAHFRDMLGYTWIDIPGSINVPLALRIDPLSITMMLVVTGVGSLIHLFSIGYMAEDTRVGRFFTYLNLFMFAMLILVLANNYVLLFVGWEGVGLCSYLLIGFWFERVSAAQAGKKAFLINRVGDFGFLLGMFALYWTTASVLQGAGTLVFNTPDHQGALDLVDRMAGMKIWGQPAVTVICLLFFLGATGKSAQLPLYMWLPDAMEGPTPVSALIHAATMVTAGVYLVARSAPLFGASHFAESVVAWTGIVTALLAAIIAIKQYDIKRILAYSTVSQLGYMFVGVGLGAYAAGISHLVTHAFFKALMFLGAGAVMHALEGQLDLRKMGNLKRYLRVTFLTFGVGWLAICGVPPFSGFFSKDFILDSAFENRVIWGSVAIGWIGMAVAAMTAFYMTRMFATVFFGSERIEMGDEGHGGAAQEHGKLQHHPHEHTHTGAEGHAHTHDQHEHVPGHHVHPEQWIMNIPLILLAIGAAAAGAVVYYLPHYLAPVTSELVREETPHFQIGPMSGIAVAAGLIGIAAAWAAVGPEKFARGWTAAQERALGFWQDAYDGFWWLVVVQGGTALALLLEWFDVHVVDGLVNLVGKVVDYFADSLGSLQTGYVRNYALVMLAGVVFVGLCFLVILQVPFQQSRQILWWIGGGLAAVAVLYAAVYALLGRRAAQQQ